MKYAFIALIALYLIIYGCSPDTTEKAKEPHKETVQTTAKTTPDSEKAAVAVEHQKPAEAVQPTVEEPVVVKEQPVVEEQPVVTEQPVAEEQQAVAVDESEMVVMPCGRKMTRAEIAEYAPPCLKMQTPEMQDTAAAAGPEQELAAALQQMVKTTNDMVMVTRQLVIATQEMLNASKKMEATPPVKESTEGQEAAPGAQQ